MHRSISNLILTFLAIFIFSAHVGAEIIGNPPYKSIKIPTSPFGDHFDMVQDHDKTLYIAYSNGVKIFDGATWHNVETGKESGIRRLLLGQKNRVYFGGAGILGYVYKDEFGEYKYKNITPEKYKNQFDDIWHMTECNDNIVFIGLYDIFLYNQKNGSFKNWNFKSKLGNGFCYNNKLTVQDREVGLVELDNDNWVKSAIHLKDNQLVYKFQHIDDDTYFLLSRSGSWRILHNNQVEYLQPEEYSPNLANYASIASLGDEQLVLGSHNGLLTFINVNNLKTQSFQLTNEWISKIISTDDGLLILTEFEIYYLQWPSAIRVQGKDSGLASSIMDVKEWNNRFYIAGSAGVFIEDEQQLEKQKRLFQKLGWTKNEAWFIFPLNSNQVILAESHKLLLIDQSNKETKIKPISEIIYPRKLIQSEYNSDIIYVITEFDVQLLIKTDEKWQLKPLFDESAISIIEDEPGSILMTIVGGGFRQLSVDLIKGEIVKHQDVSVKYQFDSSTKEGTSLILTKNNTLNAYNSYGIFELNKDQPPKELFPNIRSLLDDEVIIKLIQGDDGLYYGFSAFKLFYQDTLKKWHVIDMSQYMQGTIYDIKIFKNEIKILSNGVLISYFTDNHTEQKTDNYSLRMTSIILKQGYAEQSLPLDPEKQIEFEQGDTTLSFSCVLNDVENHALTRYRFKLDGKADGWSYFTKNNNIQISNLSAGEYTLNIQAVDVDDKVYDMPSYHFVVNPPWYLSNLAKILWLITFLLVLWLFIYQLFKRREKIYESQKQEFKQIIDSKTQELKNANIRLQKIAHLDGLTGLSNRYHLDEFIKELIRNKVINIVVMMMDMDDFKLYNDSNGHLAGDELLKKVADTSLKIIDRPGDIIARYGGEEFLVVMVDCELDFAQSKAEEIRELLESKSNKTSISIGVCHSSTQAELKNLDAIYHLIDRADRALYEAKNTGKNRIVICE